jgi:hypothetical protein
MYDGWPPSCGWYKVPQSATQLRFLTHPAAVDQVLAWVQFVKLAKLSDVVNGELGLAGPIGN